MASACITGDLHCELGEGPIYDERVDRLYFVDINKSTVYAIDAVSNVSSADACSDGSGDRSGASTVRVAFVCPTGEPASCAFLTSDPSKLLVGTDRRLRLVDLETRSSEVIGTLPEAIGATDDGARFNDGKVTPDGSHLVIGHLSLSWRTGPMGGLAVFDAATRTFKDITPAPLGIGCPNGIAWRDGKFLIVDSRDESVREYATDAHGVPDTHVTGINGSVGSDGANDGNDGNNSNDSKNPGAPHGLVRTIRQTATKHANVPDGMALDDQGNLWIAVGESGAIHCVDGATGAVIREVKVGVNRPTSCNFGGKGLEVLYVTSRVEKPGPEQSASHGGVFAVTGLGVKGANFDGKFCL